MPGRCYTEVVRVPWERARARYGSSFTTFGFATRLVISAALIMFLADLVDQIVSAEGSPPAGEGVIHGRPTVTPPQGGRPTVV